MVLKTFIGEIDKDYAAGTPGVSATDFSSRGRRTGFAGLQAPGCETQPF
jgi:hypothetical protein